MNNNKQRIIKSFIFAIVAGFCSVLLFSPNISFAAIVPTSCAEGSCTICEFFEMIQNIINFLLSLTTSLALLGLVMGGVRYMTAGSNPQLLQKAKDTFKYTAIGLGLVLGGWLIIATLLNVIGRNENQGSWYRFTCTTIEIGSGGTQGAQGRGAGGGGAVGALKGADFKSVTKWLPQINEVASKYGIDPCILVTIVRKESNGNPNTIGNDALANGVAGASAFNTNEKGKGLTQPAPLFGLKWDCSLCSWGLGLTQITIFPFTSNNNTGTILGKDKGWKDSNTPSYYDIAGKQWYTPIQLMDPKISLELGAKHFMGKMAESAKANRGLDDSFGRYNGGGNWEKKTRSKNYSKHAMAVYNACKTERDGQTGSVAAPGSFIGKSCGQYINAEPDSACLTENQNPLTKVESSDVTAYHSNYGIYLRTNTKNQLLKFAAAFKAQYGKPMMVTNAWRSLISQQCLKENDKKGIVASPAKPGDKLIGHQSGMAIDFSLDKPEGACQKHKDITGSYGFTGAAPGGIKPEEWKWMLTEGPKYGFYNLGTRSTASYAKQYDKYRSSASSDDLLSAMFCGPEAWHFDFYGEKYNQTGKSSDKATAELVCLSKQGAQSLKTVGKSLGIVGDSQTATTNSYGDLLNKKCGAISVTKYASIGKTTEQMKNDFSSTLQANHDTIIIYGGVNNLASGTDSIKSDLTTMYKLAKQQGKRVVAITIPPFKGYNANRSYETNFDAYNKTLNEVNNWIRTKPESIDYVIDAYAALRNPGTDELQEQYRESDKLHLNAAGQQRVADLIYQAVYQNSCPK